MLRRYSNKGLEKRKEERKDFPQFFQRHLINIANNDKCCEECGHRLIGDVSEIAHILDKSKYKSVSVNDDNVLYLCSWKSPNNCHSKFDNSSEEVIQSMKIFVIIFILEY